MPIIIADSLHFDIIAAWQSKPMLLALCEVTSGFSSQRAGNTESVSMCESWSKS